MTSGAWVMGTLARDPVHLKTATNYVLVVATDDYYKVGRSIRTRTSFITVFCNNRLGEQVGKYGKKGRRALVVGHLTSRPRKTPSGLTYTECAIKADKVLWLDAKKQLEGSPDPYDEIFEFDSEIPFGDEPDGTE